MRPDVTEHGHGVDLRHLRYFVAVAKDLHFGRAAERANVAQPALSRAIAQLEQRLGARLLDRTSRSVTLTRAGEALLAGSQSLLAQHQALLAEVDAVTRMNEQRLVASVSPAFAALDFACIVRGLHGVAPAAQLAIRSAGFAGSLTPLRTGESDVVVTGGPLPDDPAIATVVLRRTPRAVVVGNDHALAGRATVTLAEISSPVRLRPVSSSAEWADFWTLPQPAGRPQGGDVPFRDLEEAVEMAAGGHGAFVAPGSAAERYGRPDVRWIPIMDLPWADVVLAWPRDSHSALVRHLVTIATELATRWSEP